MSNFSGDGGSRQYAYYAMILPRIIPMMLIALIILRLLEKRENVSTSLLISLLAFVKISAIIVRNGTIFMVINRYGLSANGLLISLAVGYVLFLFMELVEKKVTNKVRAAIKKNNRGLSTGKKSD